MATKLSELLVNKVILVFTPNRAKGTRAGPQIIAGIRIKSQTSDANIR